MSRESITVTMRDGAIRLVPAAPGSSIMEIIRAAGIDDIQAICGGNCSCATCHVYIEATDLPRLAAISEDENDLLDSSRFRRPNSRLACQIKFHDGLSGVGVAIAPED